MITAPQLFPANKLRNLLWVVSLMALSAQAAPLQVLSSSGVPSSTGALGSYAPQFSADGKNLLFLSQARNLIASDGASQYLNLYVKNMVTGQIKLVSVSNAGAFANGSSGLACISSNGQFVAFESLAGNLVSGDTNGCRDIFLRDLVNQTTTLISAETTGTQSANRDAYSPVMTPDAQWIAFESKASDLALNDTNPGLDVFLRDVLNNSTKVVDLSSNGQSASASISLSGRKVAFLSTSLDLSPEGGNPFGDVFRRQMGVPSSTTWACSGLTNIVPAPYRCFSPFLNASGDRVVYKAFSLTNNLTYVCVHDFSNSSTTVISSNADPIVAPFFSENGRFVVSESDSNVFLWDIDAGTNLLISVNQSGTEPANGRSFGAIRSADGSRIAFLSDATNLTLSPCNGKPQVFVRDLTLGVTRLVSRDTNGVGSGDLTDAALSISPAGDFVAFDAAQNNLVAGDNNNASDVFLYAWDSNVVEPVSREAAGRANATGHSLSFHGPFSVSANGRYVTFTTLDRKVTSFPSTNGWNFVVWDTLQNQNVLPASWDASTGPLPPLISEDGNTLAYVVQNYSGFNWTDSLYHLNLQNGGTTLVAQGTGWPYVPDDSMKASISADGRLIAYHTDFSGIDAAISDLNQQFDVYVYDSLLATSRLVSVNYTGTKTAAGPSGNPLVSSDGNWVFFQSGAVDITNNGSCCLPAFQTRAYEYARNLGEGKTYLLPSASSDFQYPRGGNHILSSNGQFLFYDSYRQGPSVRSPSSISGFDLATRTAFLVCTNCMNPAPSADGRYIAFLATAADSAITQVHLKDQQTGRETLLSADRYGIGAANAPCTNVVMSPDARFVVFTSAASDLVDNDNNGTSDIFVRDRLLGFTTLLSVGLQGSGAGASILPGMSKDGRTVVFQSFAGDLVPGDYTGFRDVFVARLGGIDSDGDGMDDDWEVAYFGNLSRDGTGDFDHDGQTDLQEFLAGTDPTNAGSILNVISVTAINSGTVTLLWNSVPGRSYRVQYKDDLNVSAWDELSGAVTATASTASKQDTAPGVHRFYRVISGGE